MNHWLKEHFGVPLRVGRNVADVLRNTQQRPEFLQKLRGLPEVDHGHAPPAAAVIGETVERLMQLTGVQQRDAERVVATLCRNPEGVIAEAMPRQAEAGEEPNVKVRGGISQPTVVFPVPPEKALRKSGGMEKEISSDDPPPRTRTGAIDLNALADKSGVARDVAARFIVAAKAGHSATSSGRPQSEKLAEAKRLLTGPLPPLFAPKRARHKPGKPSVQAIARRITSQYERDNEKLKYDDNAMSFVQAGWAILSHKKRRNQPTRQPKAPTLGQ